MRANERGFTLLETLVAIAVSALAFVGVAGAVANALFGAARAETKIALAGDAANVLTDLRAASGYDPALLASLSGRSTSAHVEVPGARGARLITIVASVAPAATAGSYLASVTATAADGTSVTEQRLLAVEAPAPGSRISGGPVR
jgi:prepilin-type N-terminal cleavage/methylation domain-containing protein